MKRTHHYIDSIYYDIALTANVMKVLGVQIFETFDAGISPLEHVTLDTIFYHTGICQRDLAKLIFKDRANTGRVLESLEEKGLITRFVDVKNNRLVRKMGITEEGHKKLKEVNKKIESYLKNIGSTINDEEIEQLQLAIKKFRKSLLEVVNMNI